MSIIDLAITSLERILPASEYDVPFKREIKDKGQPKAVLIFLGWRTEISLYEKVFKHFDGRTKIIYQLPSKLISSDFNDMEKAWKEISESALKDANQYNIDSVYGISLGTSLALYVANRLESIKNVFLALTGHSVTSVAWISPATQVAISVAKARGCTINDFQKIFRPFDQINNIDNLNGKTIRIYLGKGDSIVPYKSALILLEKMREFGLRPIVKSVILLGHYSGAFHSMHFSAWMRA
ncbi:MAG: hypothetical protein NTZ80_00590 [Patescibacteria group bacterium]|nr:hypothetical protein [Patescibacteria group bacterium]